MLVWQQLLVCNALQEDRSDGNQQNKRRLRRKKLVDGPSRDNCMRVLLRDYRESASRRHDMQKRETKAHLGEIGHLLSVYCLQSLLLSSSLPEVQVLMDWYNSRASNGSNSLLSRHNTHHQTRYLIHNSPLNHHTSTPRHIRREHGSRMGGFRRRIRREERQHA